MMLTFPMDPLSFNLFFDTTSMARRVAVRVSGIHPILGGCCSRFADSSRRYSKIKHASPAAWLYRHTLPLEEVEEGKNDRLLELTEARNCWNFGLIVLLLRNAKTDCAFRKWASLRTSE